MDERYRVELSKRLYDPRDEVERQANMTDEELEAKEAFIRELFNKSGIVVHENTLGDRVEQSV